MFYWVLYMTAIGVLGIVFALSVSHKLRDMARFKATLAAYELFPAGLIPLAAVVIVLLELAAISALLLPVGPGLWLAFALLTIYTLALAISLLRGKTAIDCGCGGQPTPISGWVLLRNGALLVIAFPHGAATWVPGVSAWGLVTALVLLLSLIYLTVEQLLRNAHIGAHGVD